MPKEIQTAKPLKAVSGRASDALFQMFADQIASGALKEGDTLPPEREIVENYGVSRTVAREAVQALANRGLVEARPRFRPVVSRPTYETALETVGTVVSRLLADPIGVRNLFELRILLEVALVREAALSAKATDVSRLKSALEANRAAIETDAEFFKTDKEFHGVLFAVPGNPVLLSVHKAFGEWLSPHWTKMPEQPTRNAVNHEAHAAIFEAILMRDPDAAEKAMRAHLAAAWEQVRDTFDKAPGPE